MLTAFVTRFSLGLPPSGTEQPMLSERRSGIHRRNNQAHIRLMNWRPSQREMRSGAQPTLVSLPGTQDTANLFQSLNDERLGPPRGYLMLIFLSTYADCPPVALSALTRKVCGPGVKAVVSIWNLKPTYGHCGLPGKTLHTSARHTPSW